MSLADELRELAEQQQKVFEDLIRDAENEAERQEADLDSWEEQLDAKVEELAALRDSPWLREIFEAALAHDRIATEYNLRRLGFVLSTLCHEDDHEAA
jgi:hypothetical protein